MKKIISWLVGLLGLKALQFIVVALYYSVVLAFYAFIINSFAVFFNLIHIFLTHLEIISNNNNTLSKFFDLLNIIGFTPALQFTFPSLFSAISFLLLRILWKYTNQLRTDILKTALGVLGGY